MKKISSLLAYFSLFERCLLCGSVALILLSFFLGSGQSPLALTASLIGVVALILSAKGNPLGQVLILLFSLLYGVISYRATYYGEMITYLGMSAPMAVFALVSWLRNPYKGRRSEVRVDRLRRREIPLLLLFTAAVTVIFYFILRALGTASLLPSTLSVTTSFVAVYLTARRNPFYALAYAANDVVLILLWVLAWFSDPSSLSVVFCFLVFLVNDLYGFYSWRKMERRQAAETGKSKENGSTDGQLRH